MIHLVLVFNSSGKPRLAKFYARAISPSAQEQQLVLAAIFQHIAKREATSTGCCNFVDIDATSGLGLLMPKLPHARIVYRQYATLWFVMVVDESESELATLDVIQVFVESLDRCFENVCELDLIFHFEQIHFILNELIQGGLVLETSIASIVETYQLAKRQASGGGSSSSGSSSGVSRNGRMSSPVLNAAQQRLSGWAAGMLKGS
ncbi:Sigma-adaptin 3A [Sorochytrium milnesiophthora]